MKHSLLVFTALASFALPAMVPVASMAQTREVQATEDRRSDRARPRAESRPGRSQDRGPRQEPRRQLPREEVPRQVEPRLRPDVERHINRDRPQQPNIERPRPDRPQSVMPQRPGSELRPNRPRPEQRPEGRPDGRPNDGSSGQDRVPPRANDRDRDRPDRNRPDRYWNDRDRPGANQPPRVYQPNRPDRPGQAHRPDRNWSSNRDYRDFRNNWNRDRWQRDWNQRHRSDWWRNDNRFRGWSGARIGFYFAPGYGYYSVPRTYWNRHYSVGQYLPDVFWRYTVNDWRTYGLGFPPEGTRWVYVDNAIYLIDEYDGYIVEVVRDAWRW